MALDVRSLREWVEDILGRGRLSGGGLLGEPIHDFDEAPPGSDDQPVRHRIEPSRRP